MSAQSWHDQDVVKIARSLAEEVVTRQVIKQSDISETLSGIGSSISDNWNDFAGDIGPKIEQYGTAAKDWLTEPGQQPLRQGLVGAGVGGLLGAGSSMFRDKEERQPVQSALTGALTGGAMGAGAGLIAQGMGGGEAPAEGGDGSPSLDQQVSDIGDNIEKYDSMIGAEDVDHGKVLGDSVAPGVAAGGATYGAGKLIENKMRNSPGATFSRGLEGMTPQEARRTGLGPVKDSPDAYNTRGAVDEARRATSRPRARRNNASLGLGGATVNNAAVRKVMQQGRSPLTSKLPGRAGIIAGLIPLALNYLSARNNQQDYRQQFTESFGDSN